MDTVPDIPRYQVNTPAKRFRAVIRSSRTSHESKRLPQFRISASAKAVALPMSRSLSAASLMMYATHSDALSTSRRGDHCDIPVRLCGPDDWEASNTSSSRRVEALSSLCAWNNRAITQSCNWPPAHVCAANCHYGESGAPSRCTIRGPDGFKPRNL
ncbi:hypothetical protein A0H81_13995 [Grifola frondosa]|uniref:Uncharacterized protein n=1 Tax=Grifola frondosa TaxID=5627 RepID=A0A1C7LP70_GRIFR|nr:hypothetical protein A0H81_13995 [Grifola frondosa]